MKRPVWKRLISGLVLAVLWIVGLEAASRAYWWYDKDVDPFAFDGLVRAFYPELRRAKPSRNDDQRYDVLLLGGSTLNYAARAIDRRLDRQLTQPVKIHNVALPSQSSRDSLYKYRWLADRRFDLVVFYHGINEVRANNVPDELFEADYSHYSWYAVVNALFEHPEHPVLAFPFTLRFLALRVAEELGIRQVVPQDAPRDDWVDFGERIKTDISFRSNLEEILGISKERGEQLVIMSFASFVPPDYTKEKLRAGELVYTPTGGTTFPIEIWGRVNNVLAGVAAHNQVIREGAGPDGADLLREHVAYSEAEQTQVARRLRALGYLE